MPAPVRRSTLLPLSQFVKLAAGLLQSPDYLSAFAGSYKQAAVSDPMSFPLQASPEAWANCFSTWMHAVDACEDDDTDDDDPE